MEMKSKHTALPIGFNVRWYSGKDSEFDRIMEIENESFSNPWTREEFIDIVRCQAVGVMVAEYGEAVVGFIVYRVCVQYRIILNMAVDPEFRHLGVASEMVKKVVDLGGGRVPVSAYVRESNLAAQVMLRSAGFKCVKIHREHCSDTGEDAYVMVTNHEGKHVASESD